ncbi:vesicle-fusing atpase [Anaeramoeba flamelloides]|uniref:Vesicle-fusing ATPase n=1 Tax=Anaeramoeba flamelloides TaxID=1746091 RepID=A0ABQ8YDF4_9EUKA|nr:vesicle-fusing atpase [Anaeramoeba flamelloides]
MFSKKNEIVTQFMPVKSIDKEKMLTNKVYTGPEDFKSIFAENSKNQYGLINNDLVYTICPHKKVKKGCVTLSNIQKISLDIGRNDKVQITPWEVPKGSYISKISFDVDFMIINRSNPTIDATKLARRVISNFQNQVFSVGQEFVIDFDVYYLRLSVKSLKTMEIESILIINKDDEKEDEKNEKNEMEPLQNDQGILVSQSQIKFDKKQGTLLKLKGGGSGGSSLFKSDWNFEDMGIGGLDSEFSNIFRRAFASRVFPSNVIKKLGIKHVRGILLHGPPGTGKTLMARQIGKMLNGKEPKIVNGPEILNKFVGQSEENIRNLFAEAEQEQEEKGDESDLHIIIFDEIDAICRKRGTRTDGTGVGDTVVNQLLAKIDGVDSLNNILIIGMTNRKDMLDTALLRPGRLEVQMPIGLPDEDGRTEILRIHTKLMRESGSISSEVILEKIAERTPNFSGAEIEGLVKSASSFALNRHVDVNNPTKPTDMENIVVQPIDFEKALDEVKPAFGISEDEFEGCFRNGIINYGEKFEKIMYLGHSFIKQVLRSKRTPLISVLLKGKPGTGKTALAATLAIESKFPFVKMISAEKLIGFTEIGKTSEIKRIFEDAYKSPLSVIVIDDIERLLEYVHIGPRFSNKVLQTLLVLIKSLPPLGHKVLIIGTTSVPHVLEEMGFFDVFNATIEIPQLETADEIIKVLATLKIFTKKDELQKLKKALVPRKIGIKRLLMLAEMALQSSKNGKLTAETFLEFWTDYSVL